MPPQSDNLWGLILAGGEGKRLREFVRLRFNCDRPKQFCAFHGTRSMLLTTLERVRRRISDGRILVTINSRHREYAQADLAGIDEAHIIEQPENKETCSGILLPLLHIHKSDPEAIVSVFPADHYVRQEEKFMELMGSAAGYMIHHPHELLLIGAEAQYPETDYGWIEPGEIVSMADGFQIHAVRKFWEKPSFQKAEQLVRIGCLWNTMVIVGRVSAFLKKFQQLTPDLFSLFEPVARMLGSIQDKEITPKAYASAACLNFSNEILERDVTNLLVLPARGVYWSDWGRGERIEMDLSLIEEEAKSSRLKKRMAVGYY